MNRPATEMELRVAKAMEQLSGPTDYWPDSPINLARAAIRGMKLDRQDHPCLDVFQCASLAEWNAAMDIASPPDEG